jgi:predicted transglutaminase-like cysteine proteinase
MAATFQRLATLLLATLLLLATSLADGAVNRGRLRAVTLQQYGNAGLETLGDWFRLLDLAHDQAVHVQLERINQFFNIRTVFQSDLEAWGQPDYWATPLETLMHGHGDCEDFAIAKYFSLLALGIPEERLRLIYVRAQIDGGSQAHMVLGYYERPDAEPLILDNLNGLIEPASSRSDLTPIFSFNGEGLWAGGTKAGGDPTERLSRWRDLLARVRNEGSH